MSTQTFHGGCHCGAVRYAVDLDLSKGTLRCNCSLCRKSRAWFTFAPANAFSLNHGRRLLHGVVADGDCVRRTLPGRLAHHILEFRRHLADQHGGVAVFVQFEHLGAESHADPETGAYIRIDTDLHCEPAST